MLTSQGISLAAPCIHSVSTVVSLLLAKHAKHAHNVSYAVEFTSPLSIDEGTVDTLQFCFTVTEVLEENIFTHYYVNLPERKCETLFHIVHATCCLYAILRGFM